MRKYRGLQKKDSEMGVAPVVGFLLIVAILFLAAGQYQANVVPQQEREAEISHFDNATRDFTSLRTQIIKTASSGQIQTLNFDTGLRYNIIGITRPPVAGTFIHRNTTADITISNAENNGPASNFWRGNVERQYETGISSYKIDYNRYQSNPYLYMEHGFVYGDFSKGSDDRIQPVLYTDQPIINGRSITLYTVEAAGENDTLAVSRTGDTVIQANPTSAPMNSVAITNFSDGPIEIELPTRLNASTWENVVLKGEMNNSSDGFVQDVEKVNDTVVRLELVPNQTYNLRMAKITLQTQSERTAIIPPEPKYIASRNPQVNVREQSTVNLIAEARDKYNNGVIGVPVSAEAVEEESRKCIGDFLGNTADRPTKCKNTRNTAQPALSVSNANGKVRFTYQAPEIRQDKDINFIYRIEE